MFGGASEIMQLGKHGFVPKDEINPRNPSRLDKLGLHSWKYHPFLCRDENQDILDNLGWACIEQAMNDNISNTLDGLVLRNMYTELDLKKINGSNKYVIHRHDTDSSRKTQIIFGFGALNGIIPKEIIVKINDDKPFVYNTFQKKYFNWFEPAIVLRRNDSLELDIDVQQQEAKIKIYGLVAENLGVHVVG